MTANLYLADVAEAVYAPATTWNSAVIIILKLLGILFLVLLNGFFVASEFPIVKVRASQLDTLSIQGVARARITRHVINHLDTYLAATQLGITLASLGLGWLGKPFLAHMVEPLLPLVKVTSPV